jgi:aminopeptidase N
MQFKIPYRLPKQDVIAVPDFIMGAMENWGLITYREVYLLFKEGKSSAAQQAHTELVVAHEISHQWFGNLVTMEWWTE